MEIYIFDSDPSADPFDIPITGLITPGSETDVVNYAEGVILANDGQVVAVRRHDDIDDLIQTSAASNAKIVMAAPATVNDIKVGRKVFVPNGEPMSIGMVAPTIILGE